MYVVLKPDDHNQFRDKQEADALAETLGADAHKVFTEAVEKTPEQLELLYGLTLELLKVGKINPLFIKLTKIDLLGNETEITALQVINDARAWIDTHVE
jgi:hypothetical protein